MSGCVETTPHPATNTVVDHEANTVIALEMLESVKRHLEWQLAEMRRKKSKQLELQL